MHPEIDFYLFIYFKGAFYIEQSGCQNQTMDPWTVDERCSDESKVALAVPR